MSVRRAAERLVAHAEEAGYGITLKVGDDEPVVLVEPPEARQREKGAMATATHGQMTLEVEEVEADDLPRHDRIAMTVQASTRHGMARRAAPKTGGKFGNGAKTRGYRRWLLNERAGGETRNPVCAATTSRGKRCTHRALDGSDTCYGHDPGRAEERAKLTAAMRARSPLRNRIDLEDAAPLVEELLAFRELGGGWRELSRLADVPDSWLSHVAHGRQGQVATDRSRRIRDALRILTTPELARAA